MPSASFSAAGGWNLNWLNITPPATNLLAAPGAGTQLSAALTPLSLYPNPATDELTLRFAGTAESVTVADASGRIVSTLRSVPGLHPIDVSGLRGGVYVATVMLADGSRVSRRFLKQ